MESEMRVLILTISLCLALSGVKAQSALDFKTVEDSSYAMYLRGDWK